MIFTIPLLTKYLSTDEFGIYILLIQLVVMVQAALLVFFSNGILKFWVDTQEHLRRSIMGTIFTAFLVFALLLSIILYYMRDQLSTLFFPNLDKDLSFSFLYASFLVFFISTRSILLSFLKVLEKPNYILLHIFIYGVFLVLFLYIQLSFRDGGLDDVMLALSLAEFFALAVLIYPTFKYINLTFDLIHLRPFLKFSLPLVGGSLAFICFQNLDRVILARYVTLEEIGVYGVGLLFGNIAGIIVTANLSAYLPRVKKVMASGDVLEVKRLTKHYMIESLDLMLIIVIGIAFFSEFIVHAFANKFSGSLASVVMVGVSLGHLARSNYLFYKYILILKDNVKQVFLNEVLALLLGLACFYMLISNFGISGAPFASIIVYVTMSYFTYRNVFEYGMVAQDFFGPLFKPALALLLYVFSLLFDISVFFVKFVEMALLLALVHAFYKKYMLRR